MSSQDGPSDNPPMALSFLYVMTRRLLGMLLGSLRSEHAKDVEAVVLRHQLRLKGAQTCSCSSPVLVEQAAEQIASVYLALPDTGGDAQLGGWIRRFQAQRSVRAVLVVVLDIDP